MSNNIIYTEWQGEGEYACRLGQYYQRTDILKPAVYEMMGFEPESVRMWLTKPTMFLARWVLPEKGREARLQRLYEVVDALMTETGYAITGTWGNEAFLAQSLTNPLHNLAIHLVVSRRIVLVASDPNVVKAMTTGLQYLQIKGQALYLSMNHNEDRLIVDLPEFFPQEEDNDESDS